MTETTKACTHCGVEFQGRATRRYCTQKCRRAAAAIRRSAGHEPPPRFPIPVTLGPGGTGLWRKVTDQYVLRPDELETLEDACSLTDMVDAMSRAWIEEGRPLTTAGSMGQLVTHPMISEIRTHRMARNALWRQLKLPDLDTGVVEPNQQRAAANSRWAQAHGRSA